MLCLDCTFGVLVEVSSRNTFFCLYLHCTVMFTVLFCVSSGGQSFRLSSLVGEVWVVCYYLFLCGLLSLSLSRLMFFKVMKVTNKMQLHRLTDYSLSALHVSRDVFAHYQEHLTVFTVSGSIHPRSCRLVSWMS